MNAGNIRSWHTTHAGTKRKHNEDTFVDRPDLGVWAVADGAGGHQAGEVASAMIADALSGLGATLSGAELIEAVRTRMMETHDALRGEAAKRGGNAMIASTLVTLLARDGYFACLWAGDSRAYLLRDGTLRQITRDHSLVQELVDAGTIPEAEAEAHPHANVITRAIGADVGELVLDKVSGVLQAGDRFLLCSDGLSKCVPAARLELILGSDLTETSPSQVLIDAALELNASDNVTAVAIAIGAGDETGGMLDESDETIR